MYSGKNLPIRADGGKTLKKFDVAFVTIIRIIEGFQRSKQNFNIFLSLEQGRLKF
jgi:hypothetical protein